MLPANRILLIDNKQRFLEDFYYYTYTFPSIDEVSIYLHNLVGSSSEFKTWEDVGNRFEVLLPNRKCDAYIRMPIADIEEFLKTRPLLDKSL